MNTPQPRRLYEVTVTTENEVVYHSITTIDVVASAEYLKLREICTESIVRCYSSMNDCNDIEIKRLI